LAGRPDDGLPDRGEDAGLPDRGEDAGLPDRGEDVGLADRGDEPSRADEDGFTGRDGEPSRADEDGFIGGADDGPPDRDRGSTSAGAETGRSGTVSASSALGPTRGRGRDRVFEDRASARSRRRTLAIAPASRTAPPQMSSTPRSIMAFDRSPTMG
jgi:hypothetical protein